MEMMQRLEQAAIDGTLFDAVQDISIEELGGVLLNDRADFPALRNNLPRLPSEEAQVKWTGASGEVMMNLAKSIATSLGEGYEHHTGQPLANKTILDYGCGWGRIVSLMYHYTKPENIYACDPWDESLRLCKENGVRANLKLCDYVPKESFYPAETFDFVWAFSVFTHLSEKTCDAVLAAIRPAIKRNGLLAITIRPPEYWPFHQKVHHQVDIAELLTQHERRGFAFAPHNRGIADDEETYGDTSISLEYIRKSWTAWEVAGHQINKIDQLQRIVYLKPI
jgi:SAM-dependent methyltransferase